MNEKIKELAEQAGLPKYMTREVYPTVIERFAELVRADERKACADLVFEMAQLPKYENNWLPLHHAQSAIRSRGEK